VIVFTGIVEETGSLLRISDREGKRYPVISARIVTRDLKLGDSIACDGICLTVVEFTPTQFAAETMRETLLKTTVGHWRTGKRLNLERALPATGRFGGHIVQGHVDTVARVLHRRDAGGTLYLDIELPPDHRDMIVPQGAIAVNGVSLTAAAVGADSFSVALIGLTRNETNLDGLRSGERVNLEFDIVGKYLKRRWEVQSGKLTEQAMKDMGF
jgi:riboflavin synthase